MTGTVLVEIEYFGHPDLKTPYLVCVQGLVEGRYMEANKQFKTKEDAKEAIPDLVKKFVAECKKKMVGAETSTAPKPKPFTGMDQEVITL